MKKLISCLGLIFLFSSAFSNDIELKIKFKVSDEQGEKVNNIEVRLFKGNHLVSSFESNASVKLKMKSNSLYTIEVKHNDFLTKRIAVNTVLDLDTMYSNQYEFYLELEDRDKYAEIETADDVLDYPAALIEFDLESGEFDFNRAYSQSTFFARNELKKQKEAIYAQAEVE